MIETSNTATLPVPNVAQPTQQAAPKPEAKPERKRKPAQSVVKWQSGTPVSLDAKAKANVVVLKVGDKTGRFDKAGQPILSKQMVVRPKTAKEIQEDSPGTSLTDARKSSDDAGSLIKPVIAGRAMQAIADKAFMVRKYSETRPGKRERVSLTLERVNVESTIELLARQYGLKPEEVRKKLHITEDAV